jgi:hypothetical protein
MSSPYVISAPISSAARCKAYLAYNSMLPSSFVAATSVDTSYPVALLCDYKVNTEYSPLATSGPVTITVSGYSVFTLNYIGLLSRNAGDCGLSFEAFYLDLSGAGFVSLGSRGSFANGSPQMIAFDPVLTTEFKVVINFTSKCYISAIYGGEAIVFDRTVGTGYQPARNASVDEVEAFRTDGNNFIQSRRLYNGKQEKASLRYVPYTQVDAFWPEFMNHVLDSKPFFFMANNQNSKCVFGQQNPTTLAKPSYKNSHYTDLDFDIQGYA